VGGTDVTETTRTIRVQLNGDDREISENHTVHTLLESLDLHPGMIVVELNRDIIERKSYEDCAVSEGDTLELVHFVGGG
jgi:thiamine biosynthesis protein ThiS